MKIAEKKSLDTITTLRSALSIEFDSIWLIYFLLFKFLNCSQLHSKNFAVLPNSEKKSNVPLPMHILSMAASMRRISHASRWYYHLQSNRSFNCSKLVSNFQPYDLKTGQPAIVLTSFCFMTCNAGQRTIDPQKHDQTDQKRIENRVLCHCFYVCRLQYFLDQSDFVQTSRIAFHLIVMKMRISNIKIECIIV